MSGVGCREEETESCMDLNFSTFEWYVTKKVSVCEMASWTGVSTKSALLNVDRNIENLVKKYFAHIPPSSLEPLLEGLLAQIHIDLSWRIFGRNRTGDLRIIQIC